MPIAYYDGQFVDSSTLKIGVTDYGFSRGMTLFEMTRVYGGKPFKLDAHIQRFMAGATELGITIPLDTAALDAATRHIIAQNKFAHSTVRYYLTFGECGHVGGYGFKNDKDFKPHLIILEGEASPKQTETPYGHDIYAKGSGVKTVPFARHLPTVKSTNYVSGVVAARALDGTDFDEVLYVHPDGYVTETTISNFFCVIDGVLCTPRRGMLYGVTRATLIDLARGLDIKVEERDIATTELTRATEAFTSSTYIEMMPIRRIDDTHYAQTLAAPVFARLRTAYTAHVQGCCA
ncbi:MAG: aminotransferase class IV [Alphaproteobacteria bacterium]|nr:aminotransferase class IV [Alphaproteobacteria bacterium]MBV8549032.1 aminotransferase class IV [Alphaproteobacteria bacterium]